MKKKANNKHSKWIMSFAIFMIVAGVAVLMYPIVGNYLANRERSAASISYDDSLKKMSTKKRKNNTKSPKSIIHTYSISNKAIVLSQWSIKISSRMIRELWERLIFQELISNKCPFSRHIL